MKEAMSTEQQQNSSTPTHFHGISSKSVMKMLYIFYIHTAYYCKIDFE